MKNIFLNLYLIKYRTMVVGVDEKLEEYLDNNEEAKKNIRNIKS